jgi:hydrogenase/urease accessory protein HupE
MKTLVALLVGLLWLSPAFPACAHESLPVYLGIAEAAPGSFEVTWRIPATQGRPPDLSPSFPPQCESAGAPNLLPVPGALTGRWMIRCKPPGLTNQIVTIRGLDRTVLDALVRVSFADGREVTRVLHAKAPSFTVDAPRSIDVGGYFRLGVEHILFGVDHLLFVTGLVLIVRRAVRLAETVTAFTVAHSITLAAASLGFVHVPSAPVEATIALSILFLARELVRMGRGEATVTARYPWVVAFTFGLLHGFGFAGALAGIGLPKHDIPLALLMFNLGVEAGQLAFVALLLLLREGLRRADRLIPAAAARLPAYGIGGAAGFWLIQRLALIL